MPDAHKNFAYSTVATAPSPASSGTSLVVATGDGALFPTVPFNATVWPVGSQPTTTNAEIVRVTNITGDTLTITRTQEGSSARTIVVGDQVSATITALTLTDVENRLLAVSASNNLFSSGTVNFTGAGNITVSTGVGVISISGSQSIQPAVGSLNGSSGTLSISASQNATAVNNASTIIVNGPASVLFAMSVGGNTGTTGSSNIANAGFVIAGGNNVTLSQSNATISIHAQSQSVQPVAASASNGSYNFSTIKFVEGSGVTWATQAGGIQASVKTDYQTAGAYLTTAMQSGANTSFVNATAAFAGTNANGTIASNGISVSVAAQSVQPAVGSLNGSSGTLSVSGSQNATAVNNASTIIVNGPASVLFAMSVSGNTGTTGSSNIANAGFVLAGGSNITLSQSNNSISIHHSQTVQPAVGSLNGSSGTMSVSGSQNVTAVNNASTIILNGPANILNSMSIGGNTGTTGSSAITGGGFVLAGGNNVTLSQSNNTISIHGGAGASPGSVTAGMSNLGNTIGTSGTIAGSNVQMLFAGGNNITLSQSINGSSATITISGGAGGAGVALSASNAAFTSGTVVLSAAGGALTINTGVQTINFSVPAASSLSASTNITINTTGSTIRFSVADPLVVKGFEGNYNLVEHLVTQIGNSSILVQPMEVHGAFQFDGFVIPAIWSNASNSSNSGTLSIHVGVYSRNDSSLSLLHSSSSAFAVTASGTAGSYSIFGGLRNMPVGWTSTITAGNYWLAVLSMTTTGGGAGMSWSNFAGSNMNSAFSGQWSAANNATNQHYPGQGSFSAQTNSLPVSIAFSEIRGSAAVAFRPLVYFFANSYL